MAQKKSNKKKPKTESPFGSYIKIVWLSLFAGIFALTAVFVLISTTQLPDTSELENPKIELATQILDHRDRSLGAFFKYNRKNVRFEELNPNIVNALVATEDERYFDHTGIDVRSTIRAFVYLGKKGGASTITQQLAKQFFTKRSRNIVLRSWQKLKELVIATEFEKRYTKGEIMAMYLNKYDFLYESDGISAAAKTYFGKGQSELSIDESAILVGMLKNPSYYNPVRKPDNALRRRSVVMNQMVKNGYITKEEYKTLNGKPINMSNFKRTNHYEGPAPYFRAELKKWVKNLLKNENITKPDGTKYNIYTDGLIIKTTLDKDMQRHAEASLKVHMSKLQEKFFSRWKDKDIWTYKANEAQKKDRKASLNRKVRTTERFKKMRASHLSEITSKISAEIKGVRLLDGDIFRLFAEDTKVGHLAKLVKQGDITKKQSEVYKEILASGYWPVLKKKWSALQKKSKKVFAKKIPMNVFAYTASGEKTVTMSPRDSIKYHMMHMQLGSMAVDPKTGYVRTWVGGINHKYFQYDHINSNRQVGSTFKPFIYTTAITNLAMSPCYEIQDIQYTIPANDVNFGLLKSWAPANSDGFSKENLTLKEGLKKSKNSISVKLMTEIGNPELVRSLVSEFGIDKSKVPNSPSICLGSADLSVMDMTGAYTVYANDGTYTKPMFVTSIEDKNGRQIYAATSVQRKALNPKYNHAMVEMLKNASAVSALGHLKSEVGGKTGTTNDYRDGWFMGITPELIVGTWVGGEEQFMRFRSISDGAGSQMARPFFGEFMKRVEADKTINFDTEARFVIPDETLELDCDKHRANRHVEPEKNTVPEEEEFEEEF